MFDNPIFSYAGFNNADGKQPTIISLANTTNQSQEVKLFNAQENLVLENQGLPDGVLANVSAIFEMPSLETFSCYITSPFFVGFENDTTFSLRIQKAGRPAETIDYFQLNTNVIINTFKTIVGGYNKLQNDSFYDLLKTGFQLNVEATGESFGEQNLRLVFGVPNVRELGGSDGDILEVVVSNTTNGCLDRFPLTQTQTGFAASAADNTTTYQEVLQATNFQPFGVESILIQSPKLQEIAKNPIFVTERDANGNRNEQQVRLFRTPYLRPNQRILQNIREIDGGTEIRFDLPRNTTADLFIYDKQQRF